MKKELECGMKCPDCKGTGLGDIYYKNKLRPPKPVRARCGRCRGLGTLHNTTEKEVNDNELG